MILVSRRGGPPPLSVFAPPPSASVPPPGGRSAIFGYPRPLGHWVPRFQELEGLRRRTPLLVALAGRHSEKGGETGMTRGEYARDLLPPELDALPRVSRGDSRFVSCLQRWSRFPGR